MKTLTIQITTDNAAFDGENESLEVGRILVNLAHYFELPESLPDDGLNRVIRDINGNTCGYYECH